MVMKKNATNHFDSSCSNLGTNPGQKKICVSQDFSQKEHKLSFIVQMLPYIADDCHYNQVLLSWDETTTSKKMGWICNFSASPNCEKVIEYQQR